MIGWIEQQFGSYCLKCLLGRGGFAEVYLGQHVYLGTPAAIKVLLTPLIHEEQISFLHEARTIAHLVHPNIIRILDFGIQYNIPFLVMDYAPEGSLRHRHPAGSCLPAPLIISYTKQIASALQYAHNEKVIHCDVKPENMLIGRDGTILLSDFGISVAAQTTRSLKANTARLAGSVPYMAPERIQGKPRFASDQYALAITVYEWLCGSPPFQGALIEMYGQQLFMPVPPLRQKRPSISASIEQVVLKALDKDPRKRFESIYAFANALEQAYYMEIQIQTGPTITFATGPQPVASSQIEQIPTGGFPIGSQPTGSQQAIAGNHVAYSDSRLFPSTGPQAAVPPTTSAQQSPEQDMLTPSPFTQASLSQPLQPSQPIHALPTTQQGLSTELTIRERVLSRRTFLSLTSLAGATLIGGALLWHTAPGALHRPRKGDQLHLYRTSDRVLTLSWHGESIASGGTDNTVRVWRAYSSDPPLIFSGHNSEILLLAWSPDGRALASASADNTVQIWDLTTLTSKLTYTAHMQSQTGGIYALCWSPDGKYLASGGKDRKEVRVWDANSGKDVHIYTNHHSPGDSSGIFALAWSPDGNYLASGGRDNEIHVWQALNGKRVALYTNHHSIILDIAWSPDGEYIASSDDHGLVHVWRPEKTQTPFIYTGHQDIVHDLDWSPDSTYLASASQDTTVHIWKPSSSRPAYVYTGHSRTVRAVSWAEDSQLLASGGDDMTIQLWEGV